MKRIFECLSVSGVLLCLPCCDLPETCPDNEDHCSVEDGKAVCDEGYEWTNDDPDDSSRRCEEIEEECDGEYQTWANGPVLSDGCHACNMSCQYLQCRGFDDESEYDSGSMKMITYVWYCTSYKGRGGRYVSLSFLGDNGCWGLDSEYVSDGICG